MCEWSSSATTLNIKLVRNIMQFFGQVYILHNKKGVDITWRIQLQQ